MKVLKTKISNRLDIKTKRDDPRHYIKCLIIFIWSLTSYISLYFVESTTLQVMLCISMGLGFTGFGFNLFHDSIHGSLSKSRKINHFFAFLSCSQLGVAHYFWRHKHNYLHHQFTNIEDWDDDLETRDGLRLAPGQPCSARYHFQHLYAPIIYGLTTFEWIFIKDFVQYFTLKINDRQSIPKLKLPQHVEFWVSKIIYLSIFFALPLYYFPLKTFLVGLVIFHYSMSLSMAAVFQLAHIFDGSSYPEPNKETNKLSIDWVELQLSTTTNFGTSNKLLTWYAGGLNFQVEHHLLPMVSHIHYPAISKIVEETANEFAFPYHTTTSYFPALSSHFKMMKNLGQEKEQYSRKYVLQES